MNYDYITKKIVSQPENLTPSTRSGLLANFLQS